ncbi:MAG: FAD-dependent oxidoreductase [Cellvibrionaceae bacterium]
MDKSISFDTIIIGAGLSGLCLAHQLANQGIRCAILDRKEVYPNNFRADKLEHNQIAALRKAKLDQFIVPKSEPIGHIKSYRSGILEDVDTIDQYGFSYPATVNNLRENLPAQAHFEVATVVKIENSATAQKITTRSGKIISAKIIVMSTGGNESATKLVSIRRKLDPELTSLNFGFDVARTDKKPFDFRGFNYHSEDPTRGVDYVTFFLIGNDMRVNIFSQWDAKDERATAMRKNPIEEMSKYFEKLYDYVGDIDVITKVQVFPTHFYRAKDHIQPGLVVIADEYQSVSPATGRGLDKLTTDVALLSQKYIPEWLRAEKADKVDIAKYYKDKEKIKIDQRARGDWIYYRNDLRGKQATLLERIVNKIKAKFDLI